IAARNLQHFIENVRHGLYPHFAPRAPGALTALVATIADHGPRAAEPAVGVAHSRPGHNALPVDRHVTEYLRRLRAGRCSLPPARPDPLQVQGVVWHSRSRRVHMPRALRQWPAPPRQPAPSLAPGAPGVGSSAV